MNRELVENKSLAWVKKSSLILVGTSLALILASCGAMKKGVKDVEKVAERVDYKLENLFRQHGGEASKTPYWLGADEYKGGDLDVKINWAGKGSVKFVLQGEEKEFNFYNFSGDQVIFDSPKIDSQLVLVRTQDPMKVDLVLVDFDGKVLVEKDQATAVGKANRPVPASYPKFLKSEYKDEAGNSYIFDKGILKTPKGDLKYMGTNRSQGAGSIELYFDEESHGGVFYSLIYSHDMKGVDFATHLYDSGNWSTTMSESLR